MINGAQLSVMDMRHGAGRQTAVWLFFAFLSTFSTVTFAQTTSQVDSTLLSIKSLFDNGSYISAELQARRMLEDKTVSDSARVQLEKYVGFSLVAQGKNESAIEHFINALKIDSTLTLDPVLTSPKILSVFETAKRQFNSQAQKEQSQASENQFLKRNLTTEPEQGPTYRAILFPGWDQIHRGRTTKGYILLGTGAVTAISAIASDFLRRDARSQYLAAATPALASSRYKTYNFYYQSEFYSVSAFVLVYVYSELDDFLNLPPYFKIDYSPQTNTGSVGLQLHF